MRRLGGDGRSGLTALLVLRLAIGNRRRRPQRDAAPLDARAEPAIGLHAIVTSYTTLLILRICLGLAVAPAFACATHTVHRVLPFKDRARGIGLLYMGNSLGSAICPPLAVTIASSFGWRNAFLAVAAIGLAWVPLWMATAFTGAARELQLNDAIVAQHLGVH